MLLTFSQIYQHGFLEMPINPDITKFFSVFSLSFRFFFVPGRVTVRRTEELYPEEFMEWIHLWCGEIGLLINKHGLHPGPPLVELGAHLRDYLGLLGDDVVLFTRVGYEVVKLLVVDQGVAAVADGAPVILVVLR